MKTRTNRRNFLKGSAAAAAAGVGYWVSGRQTWADELKLKSPNEQLNIAWVGFGGKGKSDLEQASKHGAVTALCDIDDKFIADQSKKHEDAKTFNDFRVMFDKMGKDIDCVGISVPDHMHAVIAATAISMGKHVYCQKPMTHTVWEARQLRMAARKYKVSTQMGNQGTATDGLRTGVEYIRSGVIGAIKEVHVWTNRPIWPQSPTVVAALPEEPIPENVHWDLFLGASTKPRAFNKGYHPFKWRGWWDFGTGALGDMGCHTCNLPFMALKLEYPNSILGVSEALNPDTYPGWAHVVSEFPARGDMPALTFNWYEGHKDGNLVLPPKELADKVLKEMGSVAEATQAAAKEKAADKKGKKDRAEKPKAGPGELNRSGCIMVGEKGILYSPHDYGEVWHLLPTAEFADAKAPPKTLPRNEAGAGRKSEDEAMKIEWLTGARGGPLGMSNFDYSGLLAEFVLLGNVAIRNGGKKLEYDGPGLKFTNSSEATAMLTQDYRKGFEFPKL